MGFFFIYTFFCFLLGWGRGGLGGGALPLQIFGFWSIRITSDAP